MDWALGLTLTWLKMAPFVQGAPLRLHQARDSGLLSPDDNCLILLFFQANFRDMGEHRLVDNDTILAVIENLDRSAAFYSVIFIYSITSCYVQLHYIASYFIVLHSIKSHRTPLHCVTSHHMIIIIIRSAADAFIGSLTF